MQISMNLNHTHPHSRLVEGIVTEDMGLPVAQYVRMSTERQCYSTQNQLDAIAQYARNHGMVIARTFADEGKSGLQLRWTGWTP